MNPINLSATREIFPGGFADRSAARDLSLARDELARLRFNLEASKAIASRVARMWPDFATSAAIVGQYIDDMVHDAALEHMKAVAEERLARFEGDQDVG